jgi:hypothetical protein
MMMREEEKETRKKGEEGNKKRTVMWKEKIENESVNKNCQFLCFY